MKYFSNLDHGWADLNIGDFTCTCSYIQNIPLVILKAWKDFKDNDYCVLNIDSEGYENEIIITRNDVHVGVYKGVVSYHCLNKYFDTLAKKITLLKELGYDILSNIDEWIKWLCITEPTNPCYENIFNEYKKQVIDYAKRIEFPFKF